jgi:hypothetical protein
VFVHCTFCDAYFGVVVVVVVVERVGINLVRVNLKLVY